MKKEKEIEDKFIDKIKSLNYVYRDDIRNKKNLEKNFKKHFEKLNKVTLSDTEFDKLKSEIIMADVFEASKKLREINTIKRDDGTPLQYTLINIKDWCKNEFEVINQLRINTYNSNHRYDVIILINGIPIAQIELKALQITPKKAMEQIVNYKNDKENGYTNSILCFIQLFIVSNETKTYYFANNKKEHFSFNADERFLPIYELADERNKKISNLYDFSNKFFPKCTFAKLISQYMVLVVSEQKLMIMRPYQIYAVREIMNCIRENRGNGYIWHTTGSGKTLTSFKASTLLKDNPDIEKCLFVVDRKDLDRQTRLEFNKFQEGCVEENTNTESLVKRLESEDYRDKVIVTTIQKLGIALDENSKRNKDKKKNGELTYKERLKNLSTKRIAIIFDECHRSQFGDNHKAIKNFFPKAQMFGFTGTPIFEENSTYSQIDGTVGSNITTKDIFEKELHSYTIIDAIDDGNVLRFHIDYFKQNNDALVKISENARKRAIIKSILEKHELATNHRRYNAIFATSSINNAIEYFELFKKIQNKKGGKSEEKDYKALNIACVFSPPAEGNKDVIQLQDDLEQEKKDNKEEPDKKKIALTKIIEDYNIQYNTNRSINEFDLYYQDVQKRIKDQKYSNSDYPHKKKIDITIVVDMLLTGFDSKYLNTLYVDKSLKQHGLIQAFSRTNRILNDTKPYGNIINFSIKEEVVDKAITLFSGKENSERAKEIWLVEPLPVTIERFDKAIKELGSFMNLQELGFKPEEVSNLKGNLARVNFINKFKEIQRIKTQLDQYTDINKEEREKIEELIGEDTLRAFRGVYIEIAQALKVEQRVGYTEEEGARIQGIDPEFVLFSSTIIDYDYIMALISKYTQSDTPKREKMNKEQIVDLLCSYSNMLEESESIIEYIDTIEVGAKLNENEIKEGYQNFKKEKASKDRDIIANKHDIDKLKLQKIVDETIKFAVFDRSKLRDIIEHLDLSWKGRVQKEQEIMNDLVPYIRDVSNGREISGLEMDK